MTDETKNTAPEPEQQVDAAVGVVADDYGNVDAVAGIAVQGNQAVLVAQFADMDAAKAAYYALQDAEADRAIDIAAVLVANADYQGKVHIQKMTDHKTRNGFLWGAVGGAVIGLIFPPTILAGGRGRGHRRCRRRQGRQRDDEERGGRRARLCHRTRHVGHRGPRARSPRSTP